MTLSILSNTEPTPAELVLLPNSTTGIHLEISSTPRCVDYSECRYDVDEMLHLQTWLDISLEDAESLADEPEEDSDFIDRACIGCVHYYSSKEVEFNDHINVGGHLVYVTHVSHDSPCPCYDDGIGSIDFPCIADEEPANIGNGSIYYRHLKAGVLLYAAERDVLRVYEKARQSAYTMVIEAVHVLPGTDFEVSTTTLPVNVYDDMQVCWGTENTQPQSLPEAVSQYLESPPNNDLASVPTHNDRINCANDAPLRRLDYGVTMSMPPNGVRKVRDWDELDEENKIAPQYAVVCGSSSPLDYAQNTYLRIASSPGATFINGEQRSYVCLLMERQLVDDGNGGHIEVFRDAHAAPEDHALCAMPSSNPKECGALIGYAPLYQPQTPCTTTVSSSAPAEQAHT